MIRKFSSLLIIFLLPLFCFSQSITILDTKSFKRNGSNADTGYSHIVYGDMDYAGGEKNSNKINESFLFNFGQLGFGYYKNTNDGDFSNAGSLYLYPCQGLYSNVQFTGSGGYVIIDLYNCLGEKVLNLKTRKTKNRSNDWPGLIKKYINETFKGFVKSISYNPELTPKLDYPEVEFIDEDEESIRDYLDSNNIDVIEGIYRNVKAAKEPLFNMKIGVKKYGNVFKGIVLESYEGSRYKPGDLKFTIERTADPGTISYTWYMGAKNPRDDMGQITNTMLDFSYNIPNVGKHQLKLLKLYPSQNQSISTDESNSINWKGNGSGLIISKSGYIITNSHVVENSNELEVEFIYNNEVVKYKAEIIKQDKINDLAIIKISDTNFNGLKNLGYNINFRSSDTGTRVYAYGYPLALSIMGKEIKVTDGIISAKTGFAGDITTYQISAPIQKGNSGGPLFDDKGNLIGINSSGLKTDIADNVAYSIKSSYILNLIDVLPDRFDIPNSKRLQNLILTEQIKEISKYVVLIKIK